MARPADGLDGKPWLIVGAAATIYLVVTVYFALVWTRYGPPYALHKAAVGPDASAATPTAPRRLDEQ